MTISVVFVVHNQHEVSRLAIDNILQNTDNTVEIVVLDNGSDIPFEYEHPQIKKRIRIVRNEANCGVYPAMWWALGETLGDIICVFHSDMIVVELGWNKKVERVFKENEKLGLLGFIGSNEIDDNGGRGLGTTSNFQGNEYYQNIPRNVWKTTTAEVHGARGSGYSKVATIDGCAMIFRRSVLQSIPMRTNFPIHHFYDKLLSSEVIEAGYEVGVLGIECDHIGGQTANKEEGYHSVAQVWCELHKIAPQIVDGKPNWDMTLYREAEKQWLTEYKKKKLIPYKV